MYPSIAESKAQFAKDDDCESTRPDFESYFRFEQPWLSLPEQNHRLSSQAEQRITQCISASLQTRNISRISFEINDERLSDFHAKGRLVSPHTELQTMSLS